jgi:hypothetical protein
MKRHMIVFLLIGHYAVSPDFLMGEERYPDHPAMMKETLTPAWQGGGTPNFASRILETGPKGEGDGAKVELLTFTPSVDTAERDLPMHGGSNP